MSPSEGGEVINEDIGEGAIVELVFSEPGVLK